MTAERAFAEWSHAHYRANDLPHAGLVSKDILIAPLDPENAREYPQAENYDLLLAVFEFSDWAVQEAHFLPGEFAPIAYMSRCVEGYMASVANGGHAQFLSRYRWAPEFVRACELGLEAMGCEHEAKVFADLKVFVEADEARVVRVIEAYEGLKPRSDEIKHFDEALLGGRKLDDQVAQQAVWLRQSGSLVFVSHEKLERKRADLAKRNKRSRERGPSKADEHREPNAAVVTIARQLKTALGVPPGMFFQTWETGLNDYEPGAGPIRVRMWRFVGFDENRKRYVLDVVIVPSIRGAPPQARAYGTCGEARIDISPEAYKRAR